MESIFISSYYIFLEPRKGRAEKTSREKLYVSGRSASIILMFIFLVSFPQAMRACLPAGRSGILPERFRTSRNDRQFGPMAEITGVIIIKSMSAFQKIN